MEAKHTPGPWTDHSFTVQGSKGQIVADVCVKQPSHAAKIKPSEFEANARLIATAPELLKAAQSTVLRLADLPHWLEANGAKVLSAIVAEELAKHRAAIAKAQEGDGP